MRRVVKNNAQLERTLQWPTFTKEQVEFLERLFPVRRLGIRENVDAYRHHCGAASVVVMMREHCPELRPTSRLDYDGEEDLTPDIVQAAIDRQSGKRGE